MKVLDLTDIVEVYFDDIRTIMNKLKELLANFPELETLKIKVKRYNAIIDSGADFVISKGTCNFFN